MKLKFDFKNKKGEAEADVEKLIEKGMEQHEKNWFSKFNLKHKSKKEMEELKHKQRIEIEEIKQKKETWFEKRENAKIKKKQIEQELKMQKDKEDFKHFIIEMIFMISIPLIIFIIGKICGLE